ncbi:winged helix-turn-helix domain-containing protein [Haladaptatus pallidirubidus]|uniref:Winged helix-turn-helix domain-containing protein n=1 Tax=Haladaptatus pallidirubidus TaxID=1008152 RepID=A0AAV3US78_9EURY|nr:winged helix-turn-helix domain-containing protein [Haladaptatus pallidirubidus]
MSDQFVQQIEPEEAFAALSDETRLRILQVLWKSDVQTVPFSELRRAVGMRDPGQFNYHLDKLIGQFVIKTDGGYRLTQAGKHVNGAIASGMYTAHETLDPIVLNHLCQNSGEPLTLRYENETVRIGCDSCSSCPSGWEAPIPPAVFTGYDRDEIPEAVSQYFRTKVQQVINGFCPFCNGQMKPTVELFDTMDGDRSSENESENPSRRPLDPVILFDCQQCGTQSQVALNHALLLTDPLVASFYCENEIIVQERFIWELSELSPVRVNIESQSPLQLNVTFRVEDSILSVVVDETFDIIDIDT